MIRAVPFFGQRNPPPARHHDEQAPEPRIPIYRPFRAKLAREGRPSRSLAAFRLGHLGVSMWIWADVLWDDLSRRIMGMPYHEGSEFGVPDAAGRLLEARSVLADSIAQGVFDELRSVVERFTSRAREWIEDYRKGTFNSAQYIGREPPWEAMSWELREVCSRSLDGSSAFRPAFELGVAFGEFDLLVNRYHVDLDGASFPEIRAVGLKAAALPAAIRNRSTILGSLARIGTEYDKLGHPGALLEYFGSNRDVWNSSQSRPNHAPPKGRGGADQPLDDMVESFEGRLDELDEPLLFTRMAIGQIVRVEEDLSRLPDELLTPAWLTRRHL